MSSRSDSDGVMLRSFHRSTISSAAISGSSETHSAMQLCNGAGDPDSWLAGGIKSAVYILNVANPCLIKTCVPGSAWLQPSTHDNTFSERHDGMADFMYSRLSLVVS